MTRRDLSKQYALLARLMMISGVVLLLVGAVVWAAAPFDGPMDRMLPLLLATIGASELGLALVFSRKGKAQ
jgi:hypothetical protein